MRAVGTRAGVASPEHGEGVSEAERAILEAIRAERAAAGYADWCPRGGRWAWFVLSEAVLGRWWCALPVGGDRIEAVQVEGERVTEGANPWVPAGEPGRMLRGVPVTATAPEGRVGSLLLALGERIPSGGMLTTGGAGPVERAILAALQEALREDYEWVGMRDARVRDW